MASPSLRMASARTGPAARTGDGAAAWGARTPLGTGSTLSCPREVPAVPSWQDGQQAAPRGAGSYGGASGCWRCTVTPGCPSHRVQTCTGISGHRSRRAALQPPTPPDPSPPGSCTTPLPSATAAMAMRPWQRAPQPPALPWPRCQVPWQVTPRHAALLSPQDKHNRGVQPRGSWLPPPASARLWASRGAEGKGLVPQEGHSLPPLVPLPWQPSPLHLRFCSPQKKPLFLRNRVINFPPN